MARDFNGTTQYGTATAPVTAVPLTISAWVNLDSTTGGIFAALLRNTVSAWFGWGIDVSSGTLQAWAVDNTTFSSATKAGLTTGTWQHVCGVFASATSRTAYVDGVAGTENTTSRTPSNTAGLALGVGAGVRSAVANYADGRIAELAVWNVALSAEEIAALADRVAPVLVRPASIITYVPLIGRTSPEIDVFGFSNVTLLNTPSQSAHPPMRYPGRVQAWKYGAAAGGGFKAAWAATRSRVISAGVH